MIQYVSRRLIGLVPTALILLFLVVVMVDMIPGDIIDLMLEEKYAKNDASRLVLARDLGLDRSLMVRYVDYSFGVIRGDFGNSLWTKQPVSDLILGRAAVTAEIGVIAIVVGAALGVGVGVISATKQDGPLDYLLRSVAVLGVSVPTFVIATAVVVFPAIWWGKAPSLRYVSAGEDFIGHLKIVTLPAIVLGISLAASLMRLMRATMLEVLRQDYIRTAHAKGLSAFKVVTRHALKNAMIPVITLLGLQIAFLIGGSVVVEAVFAIPGIGRLLLGAIASRDYPVLQGIVVVIGLFVMVTNLLIDLSYAWLDPRIRYS